MKERKKGIKRTGTEERPEGEGCIEVSGRNQIINTSKWFMHKKTL